MRRTTFHIAVLALAACSESGQDGSPSPDGFRDSSGSPRSDGGEPNPTTGDGPSAPSRGDGTPDQAPPGTPAAAVFCPVGDHSQTDTVVGPLAPAASASGTETLITIDGRGEDWAGRPVLLNDPATDSEPGFPGLTIGYAFRNQHALYLYVEALYPDATYDSIEMDLEVDGRRYFVGWGPGSDHPWLADVTTEWVDLGSANRSSFTFGLGVEARLDLRDLGSPEQLRVKEVRVMVGECCEWPEWRSSDQWRPTADLPVIAEVDPAWRLVSPGGAREADIMLSAPDTSAIALDFDAASGRVQVMGNTGAVPATAMVLVGNLELNDFVTVQADILGSFEAELAAAPGTHIMVKQDTTGIIIKPEDERHRFDENMIAPGVLLRLPLKPSNDGIPFSAGARACCGDQGSAPWSITGSYDRNSLQPGEALRIIGRVSVWAPWDVRPPRDYLNLQITMLGDANGWQVGRAGKFVTPFLTATNLPIERSLSGPPMGQLHLGNTPLDWKLEDGRWVADFSEEMRLPGDLSPGLYSLTAGGLWELFQAELEPLAAFRPFDVVIRDQHAHWATLGAFTVGSPEPMRLAATLLADELSEGSRGGVLAREDRGAFDISARAATRHDPIVPRLDFYGEPWAYRLEPYVPMLDAINRALPIPPSIDFDFADSELTVVIARPDGETEVLGPAPLAQYAVKSPRTPWHDAVGRGGGELREIPQLQGPGETFAYRFPVDGDYTLTLNGHISGTDGRRYGICGTYDLTVASVLDIETSLLPGTPFEVGDVLGPTLTTMPGVPADVTYTVANVAADGTATAQTFTGRANRHGWWDGDGATFAFQREASTEWTSTPATPPQMVPCGPAACASAAWWPRPTHPWSPTAAAARTTRPRWHRPGPSRPPL